MVRSRAESPCRAWDSVPQTAAGHSAKGELKNSLVDCFLRGNALQERAFLYSYLFNTQSTRDAVSGLCQRVINPLETPFYLLYNATALSTLLLSESFKADQLSAFSGYFKTASLKLLIVSLTSKLYTLLLKMPRPK